MIDADTLRQGTDLHVCEILLELRHFAQVSFFGVTLCAFAHVLVIVRVCIRVRMFACVHDFVCACAKCMCVCVFVCFVCVSFCERFQANSTLLARNVIASAGCDQPNVNSTFTCMIEACWTTFIEVWLFYQAKNVAKQKKSAFDV